MTIHTEPNTPAVILFTPSRMARVKPYHFAYVAGAGPDASVRNEGAAVAVVVVPLEVSGPDSAIDSDCGIASRNSSASSFFCRVHPETSVSARAQPANNERAFAYIVCCLPATPSAPGAAWPGVITNSAPTPSLDHFHAFAQAASQARRAGHA